MTKPPDYHHSDIVCALIEGEQSGISERAPEDIRAAVLRREAHAGLEAYRSGDFTEISSGDELNE